MGNPRAQAVWGIPSERHHNYNRSYPLNSATGMVAHSSTLFCKQGCATSQSIGRGRPACHISVAVGDAQAAETRRQRGSRGIAPPTGFRAALGWPFACGRNCNGGWDESRMILDDLAARPGSSGQPQRTSRRGFWSIANALGHGLRGLPPTDWEDAVWHLSGSKTCART